MSGEMGSDRHFAQQQSSRPNVRFGSMLLKKSQIAGTNLLAFKKSN
jgi:hypothetical protein